MPPACYNRRHRRFPTDKLHHTDVLLNAVQEKIGGASRDALRALRRASQMQGIPVYLVGGTVRDVLLDRPLKDLDFAVEGDVPSITSLARLLATEINGQLVLHPQFGTASVTAGDARVDLATARRESYAKPGVLPQIIPASIQEDLARRDFSINALALPLAEDHPVVLDLFDGLADLRLGSVRILHHQSFTDDPTRLFRAVRYEQRLSFRIEEGTLGHLGAAVAEQRISGLSGDRIRHELQRILQEQQPELALQRASDLGFLAAIHPALEDLDPVNRLSIAAKDSKSGRSGLGESLWLAALAYPLEQTCGEGLIQKLNMPSAWQGTVRGAIELREMQPRLDIEDISGSNLFHMLEGFSEDVLRAVSMLSGSVTMKQRLGEYLDRLRHITGDVDGRELQAMGIPKGPKIGEILRRLRDARLDGAVSTKSGQLKMVQEILDGMESGGQTAESQDLGVGNG